MSLAPMPLLARRKGRPSNRRHVPTRLRNAQILICFSVGASLAGLAYYFECDVRTIERAIREAREYPELRGHLPQLASRRGRPGEDPRPGESPEQYLQRIFEAQ